MPPTLHCVRHAQGYHNLSVRNYGLHDPSLTEIGRQQCTRLGRDFPSPSSTELIVASPLRRTLYTAIFSFPGYFRRGGRIIAHPDAQEDSGLPCDTGSNPEVLEKEFGNSEVDFGLLHEGWNSKEGKYQPEPEVLRARAQRLRRWLKGRPEREIVLVTHGGFLHYFTNDWNNSGRFAGTGWANCEFRSYQFVDGSDDDAAMSEMEKSKRRRTQSWDLSDPGVTG